jgi:hypothetical protein
MLLSYTQRKTSGWGSVALQERLGALQGAPELRTNAIPFSVENGIQLPLHWHLALCLAGDQSRF